MNKSNYFRIAILWFVSVSIVAGIVYWQRSIGPENLSKEVTRPLYSNTTLKEKIPGKSPAGSTIIMDALPVIGGPTRPLYSNTTLKEKIPGKSPAAHPTSLLEYDVEGKNPREISWIYNNHGCVTCHTLTNTGLFGLTPLGKERAEGFEGCPGMLKTVWETLVIAEQEWSERQRRVRRDFVDFGCTLCHDVGPTGVGLTAIGSKAALLHMTCSEVDSTLNAKAEVEF